ncbi:MAG: hypothetical protein B7Y37_08890 [Sphingobacteriia bacterium 28-36-52]|nr:MAG: hypothetical protein B7Y37_08890 [Sphingobacteriia bacterium 28-36-52]
MANDKSSVGAIFLFLFYTGISVLCLAGVVHAYKKHDKLDFVISFFPPAAIYRGAEMFWHKDKDKFENVNWENRLKSDVHLLIMLMAANPDKADMVKFNEALEGYSNKIMEYPTERIDFIKAAARQYNRFLIAADTDISTLFNKLINEEKLDSTDFIWSTNCKPILDSIVSNYEIPELNLSYATMDSTVKSLVLNSSPNTFTSDEKNKFIQSIRIVRQAEIDKINRTYKMVFGEKLE